MSQNNSTSMPIRGIVKKTNFRYPAGTAGHWAANPSGNIGMGPKVSELIYRFVHASKYVYRLEGLSSPVYEVNPQTTEQLCLRAVQFLGNFLELNPTKRGRDFVIMDGTQWKDVVSSELFGYDILYICVFWKSDSAVVSIVTGPRKWTQGNTQWSQIVESAMQVTVFELSPNDNEVSLLHKLRNAIFSSTNFNMLRDYGSAIVRAVEATNTIDNEYPIAAANYLDGVVWYVDRPHRHHHILQSQEFQEAVAGRSHDGIIQGFLTNHGNFVTRYRAMLMALDNRMIVDTPEMAVNLGRHEQKAFHPEEEKMGGILRDQDAGWGGFRVAVVPLFSEDLF